MEGRSFTSREFRDALGTFATGVTIVTARGPGGEPVGMTASSFNSVSMDPPLVLWSVTRTARSAPAFEEAERFAVHVLSSEQVELSNRFARSGEDKFGGVEWHADEDDVPIIEGAATRFDCRRWAVHDGGDHRIIVGEVLGIERDPSDALVFSDGAYAVASPLRAPDDGEPGHEYGASPIDDLLFYNLSRAYRQMAERFHEAVREAGLTIAEWRILASLHGGAGRDLHDLAARTFVDPKALRDHVSDLEGRGWLEASRSGEWRIRATRSGDERVRHLFALSTGLEKRALGSDDPAAKKPLLEGLRRIISNTQDG